MTCDDHHGFASALAAFTAAAYARTPQPFVVYRCGECGRWHVRSSEGILRARG